MSGKRRRVAAKSRPVPKTVPIAYHLQQLYVDQDRDWVVDTVPSLIAWLTRHAGRQPVQLAVRLGGARNAPSTALLLQWDLSQLEVFDPDLRGRVARTMSGRTALREQVTELAGYGLALVAMSVLLPGSRVVDMRKGLPPDLLYDATPGALRGVEVAARTYGSWSVLRSIREDTVNRKTRKRAFGKASDLQRRQDIAEAYVSLWCGRGKVSEFVKVKP